MFSRETIELPNALIEVEARSGYLFVIETGSLTSLADVRRYCSTMERIIGKTEFDRAIMDDLLARRVDRIDAGVHAAATASLDQGQPDSGLVGQWIIDFLLA